MKFAKAQSLYSMYEINHEITYFYTKMKYVNEKSDLILNMNIKIKPYGVIIELMFY